MFAISFATKLISNKYVSNPQLINIHKLVNLFSCVSATADVNLTKEEFDKLDGQQKANAKDTKAFFAGSFIDNEIGKQNIIFRSCICLDFDAPKNSLFDTIHSLDFCAFGYETISSTKEKQKYRVVIPLSENIDKETYIYNATICTEFLGASKESIDPARLMYMPVTFIDYTPAFEFNGIFEKLFIPAKPDDSYYTDIKHRKLGSEKEGAIGDFCREFNIPKVIDTYLQDTYVEGTNGRYTYLHGSSKNGLVLFENGEECHSFHASDPAFGKSCNAFDLVLIHKFEGDTKRAVAWCAQQCIEQFDIKESGDWTLELLRDKSGKVKNMVYNIKLILKNVYPNYFLDNEFSGRREYKKGVNIRDCHESLFKEYLEKRWGIWSEVKCNNAVNILADNNKYHPVQQFLTSQIWDGVERAETLFCDTLGATDNNYTRKVTRKWLVGAVKRVMQPGCKFDMVPILQGAQGIGKSRLIVKLANGWGSDSLTTFEGQKAFEALQNCWIMELAEMSAMRKDEAEVAKHFITKQVDSYRPAYGKNIIDFLRQCVFIATTNKDTFLRDETGNRRYFPIRVGLHEPNIEIDNLDVEQLWAEVYSWYVSGEKSFLEKEDEDESARVRKRFEDRDDLSGIVEDFLSKKISGNWEKLDIYERRSYYENANGTETRTRVCIAEILCELFQLPLRQQDRMLSRRIAAIMKTMPSWKFSDTGTQRFSLYGTQRYYEKI